jgi:hypothetical protein
MRFYAFYVCSVYGMFYVFRSICTSKRLGNQHVIKLNNDNINSEDLAQRIQLHSRSRQRCRVCAFYASCPRKLPEQACLQQYHNLVVCDKHCTLCALYAWRDFTPLSRRCDNTKSRKRYAPGQTRMLRMTHCVRGHHTVIIVTVVACAANLEAVCAARLIRYH